MDKIQQTLLEQIADLHGVPEGAYNIRSDGATAARATTANIDIVTKTDKAGIDIFIKPGTKNESMHIPVIIAKTGLKEVVYNDFYIGEDCDVTIVAGCGISNCGDQDSQHDGIHSFHVGKKSKVKYVERHYAEGDGRGERIMNPVTIIELDEGAYMEMDTTQIKGVDSTKRITEAKLADGADETAVKEALDKKELSVNQGYQITRQVQDLPEDEQGQAALDLVELEKAKKEIREKDAEIDRQSKIAGVFCKAYEKAVLLTPTEENVRIWVKCTRMTKEEMEDTIQESHELAGVFTSIAGLMEHLLPERGTL